MDSRRRNRLVTLQHLVDGQDSIGQPTQTWADLTRVYANIKYLNGIESIKAGAESAAARASIRIGYRTDVTAAMRVSIREMVFQIKAVLPDEERKQHVDLSCEVLA